MTGAPSPTFVARLAQEHATCQVPPGIGSAAEVFALDLLGVLFAHYATAPSRDEATLAVAIEGVRARLASLLDLVTPRFGAVPDIAGEVERFMARLPAIHEALLRDARAHV